MFCGGNEGFKDCNTVKFVLGGGARTTARKGNALGRETAVLDPHGEVAGFIAIADLEEGFTVGFEGGSGN